jgi:hypothetical protein
MNNAMLVALTLIAGALTYTGTVYLLEDSGFLWILFVYCGGLLTAPVMFATLEG